MMAGMTGRTIVLRGDAAHLPLPSESVDLLLCSPPYFNLRSYTDGGEHYSGQLGSESTPQEWLAAMLECTREWVRVLKPSGSMFINLGDKFDSGTTTDRINPGTVKDGQGQGWNQGTPRVSLGKPKSLLGLPWRYALACMDDLGLILRRDIVWHKVNGIPESVRDRCRSSHEYLFHLVKQPRYFAAVDEIREPHMFPNPSRTKGRSMNGGIRQPKGFASMKPALNPLGNLPGSVWSIPSEPLRTPECRLVWGGRTVRWFMTWDEGWAYMRGLARDQWAWEQYEGRPSLRPEVDHFACVDTGTEILTRRGWLRHDELRDDDEVAGCDLDTGLTRWTGLYGIHRYDYDGELVTVKARGLSMRLTPNHRTLAHRYTGRHPIRQPLEMICADALTKRHSVPRAVDWADDGSGKSIGADLAALCGWVAAEGWYGPAHAVWLSQSETVNAAKVAQIDALLSRLGEWAGRPSCRNISQNSNGRWRVTVQAEKVKRRATVTAERDALQLAAEWRKQLGVDNTKRTERERNTSKPWTEVQWRLAYVLGAEIRRLMPDKLLPVWFADLPMAEARAVLEAFIAGDGHDRPDGRRAIFQKYRQNLDVLQSIAVRCGYNTTLREYGIRWVLYLSPPRPARLRRSDGTSLVGREHYRGVVWCVTTGTGTFVARREGAVFVTGNSFPTELPRRIIQGWSPSGICTVCGEGRRPVSAAEAFEAKSFAAAQQGSGRDWLGGNPATRSLGITAGERQRTITGYVCACPQPEAPARPSLVVDPFGGTGTTAVIAAALGRNVVSVDMSQDYSRLSRWRTTDRAQVARAMGVKKPPPPPPDTQPALF